MGESPWWFESTRPHQFFRDYVFKTSERFVLMSGVHVDGAGEFAILVVHAVFAETALLAASFSQCEQVKGRTTLIGVRFFPADGALKNFP